MMKYALTAKHSLLFCDLALRGNTAFYFKKALNIDYSFQDCLIRDHDLFWNFDNDTKYNDALLKNKTLNQAVDHFNKSLARATSHLEKVATKISLLKGIEMLEKKRLFVLFEEYYQAFLLNMPFLFMYWNTERLVIAQLKEDIHAIFDANPEDILQQLLVPAHETFFAKEKKSVQKIIAYAYNNKKNATFKKYISQHLRNFAFTTTSFYLGKPMTEKDVIERIKTALEDYSPKKLKEQSKGEKNAAFYRKKLLTQLDSYPEIRERLELTCELMYWKNQRLDIQFKSDFLIHPLLETIAVLMSYTFQQFSYLTYEEIIIWFKKGKLPDKKEIKKRLKSYTLYLKDGSTSLLTDKKAYPILSSEKTNKSIQSSKLIKGTIACRGKATGKVRVVRVTEDIIHIQRGEILVTSMTRPDMILGMEKAAAFVTDHGGMLSHAAIIAREMKKPCIVGTQNATRLLKTGMLVEVDANEGTVKILAN